jgi:excisionase family DNA binding protein
MKQRSEMTGVGALARKVGVSEDTIRDWDRRGIIRAVRDSGNRRQFTDEQVRAALKHAGRPVA